MARQPRSLSHPPLPHEGRPLARLQALPANAKPVTGWSNRDQAYLLILEGIREVDPF